jgi:predicted AlkP superfamily phosphohydrolase/phosphomutase
MTKPRLLVFGIDAATFDLIRPWVDRGDLPTLGRLIREGAVARLRSVPNMMTPAAWTSFATGCNPGKHGIFYFTERVPGSYSERFIKGSARALPPFWMLLSRAGVSCTVVNVPMSFPADPVNGMMVSGVDAPSAETPGFTHPPELAQDLRDRFEYLLGPASLSGAIGHLMLAGRVEEARDVLERRVQARTRLVSYLLERSPTDLCLLVHTEVDGAQHYFWKYMDPRLPGYSSRDAVRYGDGILRLYQEVDRSLAATLERFAPANVIVMSDHGAGASPGSEDGVPWIRLVLEELGLAVRETGRGTLQRSSRQALATLYRAANPRIPPALRGMVRRWIPAPLAAVKGTLRYQYEWTRTQAFCSGAAGDVWINLRGRDPQGIVEPGQEYQDLRRRIRQEFLALRDARTGAPIVEGVHFREEVYDGPFLERAPDLIIRLADVVISGVEMRGKVLELPRRVAASPKEVKTGSHRPEGILILTGAGARQGIQLNGAGLADVGPTVLYWMGQAIPSHMDGKVLVEAFTDEYLKAHPVQTSAAPTSEGRADGDYTDEEAAVVMERLRGLGYV